MKKLKDSLFIFLLTVFTGFVAFSIYSFAYPPGYEYRIAGESARYFGSSDMDSINDILDWMNLNLEYLSDGDRESDYWQTPAETLERGGGDCEDLSLLFMYLLREELDLNSSLLLVRVDGRSAVSHAIVESNGIWFELTSGKQIRYRDRFDVAYKLSYGKSLHSAETNHKWSLFTLSDHR